MATRNYVAALDLEFDSKASKILQVGVVTNKGEDIHSYVYQKKFNIDPHVVKITNITLDILQEKGVEKQKIKQQLIKTLKEVNTLYVYGKEDTRLLLLDFGIHAENYVKVIDVCELVKLGKTRLSLKEVAEALGVKSKVNHDAYADARVLFEVMKNFDLDKLKEVIKVKHAKIVLKQLLTKVPRSTVAKVLKEI